MNLYLVQHGEAYDKSENPERPLTPAGKRDVAAMANILSRFSLNAPEIWHSGKARSLQTAELLLPAMAPKGRCCLRPGIEPKDPAALIAHELRNRETDLVLVGHLPHISRLAACLLVGDEGRELVLFQKGGVAALHRNEAGQWGIEWFIVPSLIV